VIHGGAHVGDGPPVSLGAAQRYPANHIIYILLYIIILYYIYYPIGIPFIQHYDTCCSELIQSLKFLRFSWSCSGLLRSGLI
jgi:hypothetical protein